MNKLIRSFFIALLVGAFLVCGGLFLIGLIMIRDGNYLEGITLVFMNLWALMYAILP